jgi:hypothetical protein
MRVQKGHALVPSLPFPPLAPTSLLRVKLHRALVPYISGNTSEITAACAVRFAGVIACV